MHTVRYKGHIAQQDNKTGVVLVYDKAGELVSFRACDKRLSGKDLRTEVNRYIQSTREVAS